MDISRIERRIKKINSVLDVFKEDNKISSIEKDLLLGYVRELYDLIRESESDITVLNTESHTQNTVETTATPKTEFIKIEDVKKPIMTHEIEKPDVDVVMPKVEQSPIISKPVAESKPTIEAPSHQVKSEVKNTFKEILAKQNKEDEKLDELHEIFIQEEVTDISEKLSRSKIDDITKVIGINERLFTINELFGGDKNLFETIVKKLNNATDFESAKSILINEVAIPLNWEKENKLKQAQQFVKHVRRKFN